MARGKTDVRRLIVIAPQYFEDHNVITSSRRYGQALGYECGVLESYLFLVPFLATDI